MANTNNVEKVVVSIIVFFSLIGALFAHELTSTENQFIAKKIATEKYETQYSDYSIPDLTFYDHNSRIVSLSKLLTDDSPVILNFIFTSCPTICPILTSTFAKLQVSLENEIPAVQLISVSIDPEHDTPSVLHDYALKFKANKNWTFLTGKTKDIELLQKSFETFRGDKMSHIPVFFMRAAAARQWLKIEGFPSIKNIINEFRQLSASNIKKI